MRSAESRTEAWLSQFVIAENICPFAHLPQRQGRVRITTSAATDEDTATKALLTELLFLYEHTRQEVETSLLVFPHVFTNFDDFWSYVEWTEELLEEAGLRGTFQIVGFHPKFRFADSKGETDAADFTNRSPIPLLHLIREVSITEAKEAYPDIEAIPGRNAEKLRQMGHAVLSQALISY